MENLSTPCKNEIARASCLRSVAPTNRRYYTHEQYLQYRGLVSSKQGKVLAYARVSSPSQKKDLAIQKEALRAYCLEHGVKVDQWVEDSGSALNYKRKGFNQVVEQIELGQKSLCAVFVVFTMSRAVNLSRKGSLSR